MEEHGIFHFYVVDEEINLLCHQFLLLLKVILSRRRLVFSLNSYQVYINN